MEMRSLAVCAATVLLSSAAHAETTKVGFVMSYSGWFQPIDAGTINGATMAIEEINAAGGLLGQQLEVVGFDNKSDPVLGADGATDVIAKGAKMIMVPSDFDFGAAAAFIAQQSGVVALSGASDAKFGAAGIGNMAFSISNSGNAQAGILAQWAVGEKGWKSAYVLMDNTISFTQTLCGSFAKDFPALAGDGALLGQDTFLNGDAAIDAQISRLKALPAQPDVILLCSYAPGGPSAIRQLRAAGITAPVITGESMDGDYWLGTVPGLSDFYVLNYGAFSGGDSNAEVNDFFARYATRFGAPADVSYAVRGYSMIQAWARAVTTAGSTDPAAVVTALNGFANEPLLIGPTTFTADQRIATGRPMAILQATDRAFGFAGRFGLAD